MKKETNDKKLYIEPEIKLIALDSQSILAGSNEPNDNGEGDDYYHGRLN